MACLGHVVVQSLQRAFPNRGTAGGNKTLLPMIDTTSSSWRNHAAGEVFVKVNKRAMLA
jgi:hypothetical protein